MIPRRRGKLLREDNRRIKAPMKRELSNEAETEPEKKKAKVEGAVSDISTSDLKKQRVVLNPADCNLDFDIEEDGLKGSALHEDGFAYCWSGARANVGITWGKYCFGCRIISNQQVNMEDTPSDQQHVCCLGISRGDDPVGNLGESECSFGYGGTGKFSSVGKFSDFGEKFGVGDVIVCAVNLESESLASIGFAKNGKWLGTAIHFDAGVKGIAGGDSAARELPWKSAIFPHILLKNVFVLMQFSIEDGLVPIDGYRPWSTSLDDGNTIMGPTFSDMADCEMMMMVGLPASGKTTWAEKWAKDHPEKRYFLLGTNLVLDQMKVPGLLRKQNYDERFERLMGRANVMFDILLSRATRTPHNYIIDQTNVFKSARKRKLRPFANFRKIGIVVFPSPQELKCRSDKRFKEMGKEVPADALNNMIANYVLPLSKDMPGSDEFFDEVIFVELDRGEAQRHLDEMKHALGPASHPEFPHTYSPYSRESSLNSCDRVLQNNRGPLSAGSRHQQSANPPAPRLNCGYGGSNQGSYTPPLPFDSRYQMPQQVNSPYYGARSSYGAHQGFRNPSIPGALGHSGAGLRHESSTFSEGNARYSENYGVVFSGGRFDPYQNYGVFDPYDKPGSVTDSYRARTVESFLVGSARTHPFMPNTLSGQLGPIRSPRADLRAPRPPPLGPYPSVYDSPQGTPMMRPPRGNFPPTMQHSRQNANPYPRYY